MRLSWQNLNMILTRTRANTHTRNTHTPSQQARRSQFAAEKAQRTTPCERADVQMPRAGVNAACLRLLLRVLFVVYPRTTYFSPPATPPSRVALMVRR